MLCFMTLNSSSLQSVSIKRFIQMIKKYRRHVCHHIPNREIAWSICIFNPLLTSWHPNGPGQDTLPSKVTQFELDN